MTTILALIAEFTDKLGLPTPAAVMGAQDKSTKQYRALLTGTLRDLGRFRWTQQRVRASFPTVAAQLQGALTSLFGSGYNGMVQDTMWNDTRHMQILGPVADPIWNALQTLPNAGPEFQCFISRGNLYVSPAAVAAESISAIIITKNNVLDTDGVTYKPALTADTDSLVFPDDSVLAWFEYKWRKQKGEPGWEDDYNTAMDTVARNLPADGSPKLSLTPSLTFGPRPGIIIPPGNW